MKIRLVCFHYIFLFIHSVYIDPYPSRVAVLLFSGHRLGDLVNILHRFNLWLDFKWKIQVFHSHISSDKIREQTKNISYDRLILSAIKGKDCYNRESFNSMMATNVSFWETCVGDKILIFQPDTAFCSNSPYFIDLFLAYDFIGAPLPMIYFTGPRFGEKINIKEDNDFYGGNGGFSLRSKASMVECSRLANNGSLIYPEIPGEQEDMFFAKCLKYHLKNQNLPCRRVAAAFSAESTMENSKPMAVHKPWAHMESNVWLNLVDYCPEANWAKQNSLSLW